MDAKNIIRVLGSRVLTQRHHHTVEAVKDPVYGGVVNLSFDDVGCGLVLPAAKKDVNRATVLRAGPECHVREGSTVIIPNVKDSAPIASWYDSTGELLEIWWESQLDASAMAVEA